MAQVRLSPSDPVLKQLFTSWASNLAKDGNYELAAKWYLTILIVFNHMTVCVMLMVRYSTLSSLLGLCVVFEVTSSHLTLQLKNIS